MKFIQLLVLMLAFIGQVNAQSLYWPTTCNDNEVVVSRQALGLSNYEDITDDQVETFSLSPLSYYAGGGMTYQFGASNSFDEQFAVTADLVFNILPSINLLGTKLNIPFRGSLQALLGQPTGDTDFQLGVYPFLQWPEKRPGYDLIIHGAYEGKVNPESEFSMSDRLTRVFLGAEASIYTNQNSRPVVVGAVAAYTNEFFTVGDLGEMTNDNSFGVEGTVIFQVVEGFGILARGYYGFDGPRPDGVQTGVILIGANKGR